MCSFRFCPALHKAIGFDLLPHRLLARILKKKQNLFNFSYAKSGIISLLYFPLWRATMQIAPFPPPEFTLLLWAKNGGAYFLLTRWH